MKEDFANVYEDDTRARAYASLDFPGTYFLAFRDIPELIERHVRGNMALDFGCGAGRSTRFLKQLGFQVLGVDSSQAMLRQAVARDSGGDYRLVNGRDLSGIAGRQFDVVLCAFTFDNIPDRVLRVELFRSLRALLTTQGRIINLVSAPEIYLNEWASFSTQQFPENRNAKSGELVRIVMKDVIDSRPVEDVVWTDEDYQATFASAGLQVLETHRPLGRPTDMQPWISETTVAPWTIYVLAATQ